MNLQVGISQEQCSLAFPSSMLQFLGCEEHISDSEDTEITEFKNNIVDAKAQAEALNRPMLFDFTGHACVNCRKVEEQIWTDQGVHQLIEEDFILTSLYVDERTILPKEKQCVVTIDGNERGKSSSVLKEIFGQRFRL